MNRYTIITPSVTYALKGRDALRRAGISAQVERRNRAKGGSCGYGIETKGDIKRIEQILRGASVKILEISDN